VSDAREPPVDEPVVIPVTGELDLHPFAPREIPSVVEEYVRACGERGILRLRLARAPEAEPKKIAIKH